MHASWGGVQLGKCVRVLNRAGALDVQLGKRVRGLNRVCALDTCTGVLQSMPTAMRRPAVICGQCLRSSASVWQARSDFISLPTCAPRAGRSDLGGADITGADFTNALLDKTQQIVRALVLAARQRVLVCWLGQLMPACQPGMLKGTAALGALATHAMSLHLARARTFCGGNTTVMQTALPADERLLRAPLSPASRAWPLEHASRAEPGSQPQERAGRAEPGSRSHAHADRAEPGSARRRCAATRTAPTASRAPTRARAWAAAAGGASARPRPAAPRGRRRAPHWQ